MMCKSMKPAAWVVAAPMFPFLAAAWVGGASRSKRSSCWQTVEHDKNCSDAIGTASQGREASPARPAKNIVETAIAASSFSALVQAVTAADLADALQGEGPFTVFAPTDEAFAKLPEGTIGELLEDKEKLVAVLTLHVVPGRLDAASLSGIAAAKTLQGETLTIDTSMGVKVGSAYVIQPDIETSNGVIHAIDSVLLPG